MRNPNCFEPGDEAVFVSPIAVMVLPPEVRVAPFTANVYPLAAFVETDKVCASTSVPEPVEVLANRAAVEDKSPKAMLFAEALRVIKGIPKAVAQIFVV